MKGKVKDLHGRIDALRVYMEAAYKNQLVRIPRNVRQMKLGDYKKRFGAQELLASATVAAVNAASCATAKSAAQTKMVCATKEAVSSVRRSTRSSARVARSRLSASVQKPPPTRTTPAVATTQQPISRTRSRSSARNLAAAAANPLHKDDFVTPAAGARAGGRRIHVDAEPDFDPRLATTPYTRSARRGERIMSLRGSPINIEASTAPRATLDVDKAVVTLPIGQGKVLSLWRRRAKPTLSLFSDLALPYSFLRCPTLGTLPPKRKVCDTRVGRVAVVGHLPLKADPFASPSSPFTLIPLHSHDKEGQARGRQAAAAAAGTDCQTAG